MADNVLTRLRTVNTKVDKLKSDRARLGGRRDQLLQDLKTNFGIDDIKEAEEMLVNLKDKKEVAEADLLKLVEKMEEVVENCEDSR